MVWPGCGLAPPPPGLSRWLGRHKAHTELLNQTCILTLPRAQPDFQLKSLVLILRLIPSHTSPKKIMSHTYISQADYENHVEFVIKDRPLSS